jgi:guanylate kinase
MNKALKIIPMGLSGCGKDTFAKHFGKQLISITTRPPRYTGEAAHIFVSEEEANKMTERVAETVINGYQYFATKEQFDECDVYVLDPNGLRDLCQRVTDVDLSVVYINASKETRRQRAIERAEDKEEAGKIFDKRYEDEHKMFDDFVALFENDDLTEFHKLYPTVQSVIVVDNENNDMKKVQEKIELIDMYANQINFGDEFAPHIYRI